MNHAGYSEAFTSKDDPQVKKKKIILWTKASVNQRESLIIVSKLLLVSLFLTFKNTPRPTFQSHATVKSDGS